MDLVYLDNVDNDMKLRSIYGDIIYEYDMESGRYVNHSSGDRVLTISPTRMVWDEGLCSIDIYELTFVNVSR